MKYLIITDGNKNYFPSDSRNSIKHLIENNANNCWVYDQNGWWVSFAEKSKNGKIHHPKMFLDGEQRLEYVNILKEYNNKVS